MHGESGRKAHDHTIIRRLRLLRAVVFHASLIFGNEHPWMGKIIITKKDYDPLRQKSGQIELTVRTWNTAII